MKKVVILGAGYAGVLTAKKLCKRIRGNREVKVTIIDRNPFHTMLTELHEVAAGRVGEESVRMDLRKIFFGRPVEVVTDSILSIDIEGRRLEGALGSYPYDILVLAAGSRPTFFGVTGAQENAFTLWSYEDAVRLRERVHQSFRRAMAETDAKRRRQILSFYVVGAGFTGVEMAGELAEYLPILCEEYGVPPTEAAVVNVDLLKRVVPVLPEKLSAKVERRLRKMGVRVMLGTGVTGIWEDAIELKEAGKVVRHPAGTVIWTAGIESAGVTGEAAKTLESSGRGRIRTDKYLRALGHPEIYVVGDNLMYLPEGDSAPVPQMVENCEQSAHTAAYNIAASLTGEGKAEGYHPKFHGVMVSVGGRYGAAHVGLPGHMISLPSFLAMFAKHFINLTYFVQVLGWNKIFSYLRHEFFTIRHCRSFVGGHFSNRTPSFLLVPLRLWLGAVWIYEAVMKILEGWLSSPKLQGFFGGASAWYNGILQAAGAGAVEAVASATQDSAQSPGAAIFYYRVLGFFDTLFVCGVSPAEATLQDYAFKLNVPLLDWFLNWAVLPNDGVQVFMQAFIVFAELMIGLCLMGGLFTAPASAFSLLLQFMFICTTGLYLGTAWMIFAAVAMLIGAGRTLGLDYYAMPPLKRGWGKIPFVRKWYLYHD